MRCGACPRNEGGRHTSLVWPQEPERTDVAPGAAGAGGHHRRSACGPSAGDDRTDAEEEAHAGTLPPSQAHCPEPGRAPGHHVPHLTAGSRLERGLDPDDAWIIDTLIELKRDYLDIADPTVWPADDAAQAEQTEQTAQAEQAEQTEQTAQAEQAEQTEQTAQAEQAEQTEQTAQAEQAEQTEQ